MANVHKAHKSSKKYSFQRSSKLRNWIIAIVAVIAVIVIGVVVYNNSLTGKIKVAAPAEASLNNIADNWSVLASHTDKFASYPATNEDGTQSTERATLQYIGSENADTVYIYIRPETEEPITNEGVWGRPSIFTVDLGQLSAGTVSLKDTTVVMQAGNENCVIYLEDYKAAATDDSAMAAVIAELEAIIAAGPVLPEETPDAADAPATEETPEVPAE